MAAAALSRRGVAGVRTTKGLFFIVTLLSLVCVASSWMDKDQLEMHKEYLQRAQEELDSLKEEKATHSEFISDFISLLHPLTELMKKRSNVFSDIPLEGFLESIKIMEKNSEQNEKIGRKLEDMLQKLEKMKKLIKSMEEQQAEL